MKTQRQKDLARHHKLNKPHVQDIYKTISTKTIIITPFNIN